MARTTTNYGWNISEGTDLVNPLTDIFPNFESQDTDLKNVSNCSIGTATELKTGTVHALTRDDSDKDVFKFTATSNFTAGDTFTVDGDQVSALTTAGEQLQTGCYIIGSEVLVLKKGTLLTMYVSSDNATTLDGHNASYFATASDLSDTNDDVSALSTKVGTATLTTTAPDLSGAVNELNSNLTAYSQWYDVSAYVASGWVCPKDGYMKIYMNPSSTNPAYTMVSSSDEDEMLGGVFLTALSPGGTTVQNEGTVTAGNTYTRIADVGGISKILYRWKNAN